MTIIITVIITVAVMLVGNMFYKLYKQEQEELKQLEQKHLKQFIEQTIDNKLKSIITEE
jgi:Tfp pilus assembly protein PilO